MAARLFSYRVHLTIAIAIKEDMTLIRVLGLSKPWGNGNLLLMNLFAFKSKFLMILKTYFEPINKRNDHGSSAFASEWAS